MRIGIVGGTGREGGGLALRWARAGHTVAIGSRDADRARARAEELRAGGVAGIEGGDNESVVSGAEVVVLTVPYGAHEGTLRALAGKLAGRVLIDITVPLKPPKVTQVHLPAGQSAALEAQAIVGAATPVVATLHHVSSAHLGDPDHALEGDVLACSNDPKAMEIALGLLKDLGARGLDAGPLENAVALESLTPVLLSMSRRYKSPSLGITITGLRPESAAR